MKSHLGQREPAREGLARINRELCERTLHTITGRSVMTASAVFELHKSVETLRAILRIARPALEKPAFLKLDRLLHEYGREPGRLRDSAARVDTLVSLLAHFRPYPDEAALLPARDALRCRFTVALEDFLQRNDAQSLAAEFGAIEQQISALELRHFSRPMLLAGIEKTYRRCRTRLLKLHAEPGTSNSHKLRRQVKYAWNQLWLIHKWGHGTFKPLLADLDRLDSLLGEDSDIAVLVEAVQRHPEICCGRIRSEFIVALAEARRSALLTASLRLAEEVFAGPPRSFGQRLRRAGGRRL